MVAHPEPLPDDDRLMIAFRTYLKAHDLTLEGIAEFLGRPVQYIDDQVNGDLGLRLDVLTTVAHLTGTDAESLATRLQRTDQVPSRDHSGGDLRSRHNQRRRHH